MTEPSGRELSDKIAEVREWLVKIDTKVDYLNEVKRTAEDAKDIAIEAKKLSEENREEIKRVEADLKEDIRTMQDNSKWVWGPILSFLAIAVSIGIAIFT